MSITNHSSASSALCNDYVSGEGQKPPMTIANESPAPSAVRYSNASAKGKKPLRPLPMSSTKHSTAPSVVFNDNVSAKGKESASERPFNEAIEAGPSTIGGSSTLCPDALSDSFRMSLQRSFYSGDVLHRSPILNHNYDSSSNGVIGNVEPLLPSPNVPSLGLPNGKGNCSRGDNRSQGGYGYRYDKDRHHEMMLNSYRGLNGMVPLMHLPREQLRTYPLPLISPPLCPVPFIGNPLPSIWSPFQVPTYVPFDVYHFPVHAQAQYLGKPSHYVPRPEIDPAQPQPQYLGGPSYYVPHMEIDQARPQPQFLGGPSYSVPRPEIDAAQQSDFSSLMDDLRARMRKQIEYYFSSENLCTDGYLKSHMDGHGWVPATLIMKFRKVVKLLHDKKTIMQSASISDVLQVQDRSLSNDEQFVLDSLRPSDVVEVQGDKMRARHEWEKWVLPQVPTDAIDKSGNRSPPPLD